MNTAERQQAMWMRTYRGTRVWDQARDEAIKRHVKHIERHPCVHRRDHLKALPICPECLKQHALMVYDFWG